LWGILRMLAGRCRRWVSCRSGCCGSSSLSI
jgi:hypothetical protein